MYKKDVVSKLVCKFHENKLNFHLNDEDLEVFTWEAQEEFIQATVKSNLLKRYPVSNEFTRLFFKKLINDLNNKQEVHDDFYHAICSISNKEESFCYKHYMVGSNKNNTITMKETKNMVVNGTTGMKTWEAAVMLSDWALSNKDEFQNRAVLELGCGIGFTGITLAKYCKLKHLWLTDYHHTVLETVCENIEINFPDSSRNKGDNWNSFQSDHVEIDVFPLDWNDLVDIPPTVIPDIIIGADIIYDPAIMEPLCTVLQYYFNKNPNLIVFIQSVIRNEETFGLFLEMLGQKYVWKLEKILQEKSINLDWDNTVNKCLLKIKSENC